MNTGIYEIVNTTNGKRYVGSAVNFSERWKGHRLGLKKGKHHSRALQRAHDKYGLGVFHFRKLLICSRENLIMYEQIAMDGLRPEYNTCKVAGSALGLTHTPETRAKMSAAHVGHKRNIGRKASPEARAKMSASRIGKRQSPESVEKRAAIIRGRKMSPEACAKNSEAQKGKRISAEHRAKISAALIGRKRPPEVVAKFTAALKGRTFSDDTKAKMSASKIGNAYKKGKKCSPETRARMVVAWEKRRQEIRL